MNVRRAFWWTFACLLAVKLVLAASLELFGDEAFYAWESRHLAAAYSDLPALTAWLIAAGRNLFGDHVLGIRLPFLALAAALPFIVLRLGRRWAGEDDAWRAALIALLLPLSASLGVLALPDVAMLVLALLALDAFDRALATGRVWPWLQTGLWVALGMNTHYRFLVPVAAALLVLVASARARPAWKTPGLWLAFAIAGIGLVPQILFHVETGGAALGFQFVDRHPWAFQWQGLQHLPVQAMVTSPVLYLGLLATLLTLLRRPIAAAPRDLLLAFAGLPVLVYLVAAFFADNVRTHFHWPLIGYLPLLPLLPPWWRSFSAAWPWVLRRSVVALGLGLAVAGSIAALGYLALAARSPWTMALADHKAFPSNMTGWREAAESAWHHLDRPEFANADLVADNFMIGAQLEFELGGVWPVFVLDHPRNHHHGRAVQLALWRRDEQSWREHGAARALLVVEDTAVALKDRPAWYHELCARLGNMRLLGERSLFAGRRRFLYFQVERQEESAEDACQFPALAYIDLPPDLVASRNEPLSVSGWAIQDGTGIRSVTVLIDGEDIAEARYGLPFSGVQAQWPFSTDPNHPDVGFAAEVDLSQLAPGRYRLGLRLTGRDGSVREFPEEMLVVR
jgi:4-amino-4-deoxy-L-arabinose transferase-like glycosyltransferase